MGLHELLALSVAGNIVLAWAYVKAKHKLHRAHFILVEVAEGRAEISRYGEQGIAITSKIVSKA